MFTKQSFAHTTLIKCRKHQHEHTFNVMCIFAFRRNVPCIPCDNTFSERFKQLNSKFVCCCYLETRRLWTSALKLFFIQYVIVPIQTNMKTFSLRLVPHAENCCCDLSVWILCLIGITVYVRKDTRFEATYVETTASSAVVWYTAHAGCPSDLNRGILCLSTTHWRDNWTEVLLSGV